MMIYDMWCIYVHMQITRNDVVAVELELDARMRGCARFRGFNKWKQASLRIIVRGRDAMPNASCLCHAHSLGQHVA